LRWSIKQYKIFKYWYFFDVLIDLIQHIRNLV
jgi:hypothetical protein